MCHIVPVCYHRSVATRAEHRRQTLLALSRATTHELQARGLDATINDIANRAGVARRTVYRWVDSRDDLVFIHPRLWIEIFDDALTALGEAPLRERVLHGSRAVSAHIDADPQPVIDAMAIALEYPSLMRGYATVNQEWIDRMAGEVLGASTDPSARFRSRVLGAAIMGVIDAALTGWLEHGGAKPLIGFVEAGLELLAPILDD